MKMTKRDQVKKIVTQFKNSKQAIWGHAYTSGYFETLVIELLTNANEVDRALVLKQLEKSV
jgi:hypothetical protein